ncbi:distal tail protein [Vibrio phage D51]
MRLPDPFTSNVAPGFSSAILGDVDPQIQDPMSDGSVLRVNTASQYWTISLAYPDLTRDEFDFLVGTLAEAKRLREDIQVLLPQYEMFSVSGDTNSTNIAQGQTGTEITIGGTSALTGRPRINSLFKLSGCTKVYKITSFTDLGGSWTLGVYPDLVETTDGTEKPQFNSILFNVVLIEPKLPNEDPSVEDALYRGVTLEFRENVQHGI